MKYFTSAKLADLLRNIISVIPSAKSGFLNSLNAGCNIKKNAPDPYQKNLSCYEFGSVVTMCFMTGKKNGRHWLNMLESGLRLLWDHKSQREHCWSKDHREIGPDHVLMQMSIVFLTSVDLQWLIPDEVMRWFGCAVPSWKAVERCSGISTRIASPEANTRCNGVPFKQTWKGKKHQHLCLCWWRDRLWWKDKKQWSGVWKGDNKGNVKWRRQKEHQQIILELVGLHCSHCLHKTLVCTCFYTSLDGHWGLTQQGLKCVFLGTGRRKDEACSEGGLATAAAQPSQL